MRVYIDSAPIIYFVEATPVFAEAVEQRIGETGSETVSCELVFLECLVKPLRDDDVDRRLTRFTGITVEILVA